MKKTFYRLLTILLTLQLSFLIHGLIETRFIKISLAQGDVLTDTNFLGGLYCVLPSWLSYGLLFTAIVGGFFLGQVWWRIVYVEKRHWRMKRKSVK